MKKLALTLLACTALSTAMGMPASADDDSFIFRYKAELVTPADGGGPGDGDDDDDGGDPEDPGDGDDGEDPGDDEETEDPEEEFTDPGTMNFTVTPSGSPSRPQWYTQCFESEGGFGNYAYMAFLDEPPAWATGFDIVPRSQAGQPPAGDIGSGKAGLPGYETIMDGGGGFEFFSGTTTEEEPCVRVHFDAKPGAGDAPAVVEFHGADFAEPFSGAENGGMPDAFSVWSYSIVPQGESEGPFGPDTSGPIDWTDAPEEDGEMIEVVWPGPYGLSLAPTQDTWDGTNPEDGSWMRAARFCYRASGGYGNYRYTLAVEGGLPSWAEYLGLKRSDEDLSVYTPSDRTAYPSPDEPPHIIGTTDHDEICVGVKALNSIDTAGEIVMRVTVDDYAIGGSVSPSNSNGRARATIRWSFPETAGPTNPCPGGLC